jgi:hypothetical protein
MAPKTLDGCIVCGFAATASSINDHKRTPS